VAADGSFRTLGEAIVEGSALSSPIRDLEELLFEAHTGVAALLICQRSLSDD
jgi:hypothetical protein